MNISYYNSLPPKGEPHKASGSMSILEFLNKIKYGHWKQLVEPIRAEEDKKRRDMLKKGLVSVTISGVFAERLESKIIHHSGYIAIDVDNYTDKSQILQDPYTFSCFDSVSAKGFVVIVKVDPSKHKESFRWLQKYYYEKYGITVDPAPQNPASLRYVSYDDKMFLNEKSKISKSLPKELPKPKTLAVILTGDKIDEYVAEVVQKGIDLAPTYADYLNLSFALVDGLGESGRNHFHSLCSVSPKYNDRHADKQYDIAIKRGKTGVTVGTFYHMLKQAGINIKPENNQTVAAAVMAKKNGKTKDAVIQQLISVNNLPVSTAELLVEQVYERSDITLQTISADPEKLIETLINYIGTTHDLKRNAITRIIEEGNSDLTEERMNTIYLRARSVFNTPNITFDLVSRTIKSEFTPTYHPITDYINKNDHRTSTGNLDKLITTIQTNSEMAPMLIRKWCIGIIAAYKGYPVRSLLALLGGQYTGKTEWFRRLLPADLKKYYGESKLDAGKDDELLMTSKLILMNDEMGGKNKHDEKLLKDLTSKDVFSLRAPYGRHNEDFKRLAVLCGTSNEIEIMQDPTGNTRIFPIEVISIDHEVYNSIDKDELFMELYRLYEEGEEWKLTAEERERLKALSKGYEGIQFERELLVNFFKPSTEQGFVEELTATQIKNYIEQNSRQQIKNMKLFGGELRKYFGDRRQAKGIGYVFKVIKKGSNENSIFSNIENVKVPETPVNPPIFDNFDDTKGLPF